MDTEINLTEETPKDIVPAKSHKPEPAPVTATTPAPVPEKRKKIGQIEILRATSPYAQMDFFEASLIHKTFAKGVVLPIYAVSEIGDTVWYEIEGGFICGKHAWGPMTAAIEFARRME